MTDLNALSKAELYELAQTYNVAGRSSMSATELRAALQAVLVKDDSADDAVDAAQEARSNRMPRGKHWKPRKKRWH